MFTGIIQEKGEVRSLAVSGNRARLRLRASALAPKVKIGDSVAVSGVCLTAVSIEGEDLEFDMVKTTLDRTALKRLKRGSLVNLELALRLNDRLGGHMVSGHIDAVGRISKIERRPEEWRFRVDAPREVLDQTIPRGSIAIDGISLTVAELREGSFEVAVIPHTLETTTLAHAAEGDPVNLECDLIGKWVARHLNVAKEGPSGLTMEKLWEEGYR